MIDLRTLDETDPDVFHTVYYKEVPLVTGDMDETIIVTYSPKYKAYQQKFVVVRLTVRLKMIQSPENADEERIKTIPARFIQKPPLHQMAKSQISLFMNWIKNA